MDRIFYYDAYKIEKANNRTGFLISSILHALLLLIILWRFMEVPVEEEKTITVELLMPVKPIVLKPEVIPGGGSSPGPESEEPQEGGSKGSEAPPALEEMEKQASKIDVIRPTPIPVTASPKPVLTAPQPQVVKIDPPKVETNTKPSATPANPAPVVVTPPSKPATNQGGATGTSGQSSTGDNDYSGTGGSGTGSGTGSGAGGANSGSGTGGGGNQGSGTGTGSGDGIGVNFDETGPLRRAICKRANIFDLAREYVQSISFDMCINQKGAVTYIKYNSRLSKTKDRNFVLEATKKMQQYEFCPNMNAPRKECGTFTFNIEGIINKKR